MLVLVTPQMPHSMWLSRQATRSEWSTKPWIQQLRPRYRPAASWRKTTQTLIREPKNTPPLPNQRMRRNCSSRSKLFSLIFSAEIIENMRHIFKIIQSQKMQSQAPPYEKLKLIPFSSLVHVHQSQLSNVWRHSRSYKRHKRKRAHEHGWWLVNRRYGFIFPCTKSTCSNVCFHFQKLKSTHSLLAKSSSSEQIGKHIRANSATRYGQSAQKPGLSKSQSVEEIRKKTQVSESTRSLAKFKIYKIIWCFLGGCRWKKEETRR